MKRLILLLLAGLMIYLIMVLWTLPTITKEANGLLPFDLRPSGYSGAEAMTFRQALTGRGEWVYRYIQFPLDLVYPMLLFLFLFHAFSLLSPRSLLKWLPALGMVFDYLENFLVQAFLLGGGTEIVKLASVMTILKSIGVSISLSVLIILSVRWFITRRKEKAYDLEV